MRLIDADRLYSTIIDEVDPISISMDGGEMCSMMRTIIAAEPTIDAVPLDKLCEWLERYAMMDCMGCRKAFRICEDEENQEVSVCNSRERWKAMLTKWMEGLDAEVH